MTEEIYQCGDHYRVYSTQNDFIKDLLTWPSTTKCAMYHQAGKLIAQEVSLSDPKQIKKAKALLAKRHKDVQYVSGMKESQG